MPSGLAGLVRAGEPSSPLAVVKYLETLSRPDGGYAWDEESPSHLTATFAVIGCYRLLGQPFPNKPALAAYVRSHHPSKLKKLEQEHREFERQQLQSLLWLGEDVSVFRALAGGWMSPLVYLKQYEQHGYPILRFEVAAILCRKLTGLPMSELPAPYIACLDERRRPNGSFNNTPARDGGDGHVLNTCWGLQALQALGRIGEKKAETVAWLRACQLETGGFTYQPAATLGGWDDVAYTWAAVNALKQLGAQPGRVNESRNYLLSLWNEDGGFADRPGWASSPLACYYALDALSALGALDALQKERERARCRPTRVESLPADLNVYSVQIEAHGQGSPAEAVELAASLRIHLWGAKNADARWIQRAQALADARKVPVTFFIANEEYGTWVEFPGLGTYSHTSDVIAPAGSAFGSSLASHGVVSWPAFRERRLQPLLGAQGRLIWQFGENEELVRLYLDDSIRRGGYAAISTFHFGNPDFTNTEPFLHRYRGQLPFVALQDAHGSEPWWFADMTTGFRTVFLAHQPDWKGWLNALERNWVAAVRRDAVSGSETWMHSGSRTVGDYLREHWSHWQWWDNPAIRRPLISLVAVRPEDEFEVARPESGITLRVRCARQNTAQGLPAKPLVELVRLLVDDAEVAPILVAPAQGRGAYRDYYHHHHLPAPTTGVHRARVVVREVETRREHEKTIEFRT